MHTMCCKFTPELNLEQFVWLYLGHINLGSKKSSAGLEERSEICGHETRNAKVALFKVRNTTLKV